jgi:hypothetical protein
MTGSGSPNSITSSAMAGVESTIKAKPRSRAHGRIRVIGEARALSCVRPKKSEPSKIRPQRDAVRPRRLQCALD